MQDYYEAIDFVNYKKNLVIGDKSKFDRVANEHIEFREKQRQSRQRKMFKNDRMKREEAYFSIFENLTISTMSDGISCLRRLEIRYLPLDPLLVIQLFKALKINIVL